MAKKAAKKAPAKKAASAVAPPVKEADWTLLIYLAGDNNLDPFGGRDVLEMKKVGSSDRLHIIVQRDTTQATAPASRYRIRKGTSLEEDILEDLGDINTGDPEVLRDFLEWGLGNYPAKRTMVVLWNHGSGWDDENIYLEARKRGLNPVSKRDLGDMVTSGPLRRNATPAWTINRHTTRSQKRGPFFLTAFKVQTMGTQRRAIAFDDGAQDFLDSVEMKNVLKSVVEAHGKKFDVIGMDACLMSMLEVGLQVKDAAEVMCGSQDLEPGDGWPYDTILSALAADLSMDGKSLCRTIVDKFIASYPTSEVVTQSAVDLDKLSAVQAATDALGRQLAKGYQTDDYQVISAAERATRRAQRYDPANKAQYVDLHDFCAHLITTLPAIAPLAAKVQATVLDCVFSTQAPHPTVAKSHGLSVYLPYGGVSELYQNLDFGKGGWARFLTARVS